MTYTSSCTLTSLVLEIGTGSGYHAALLCQRLGGARITSVDIDPELVELAGERLGANGYTPGPGRRRRPHRLPPGRAV